MANTFKNIGFVMVVLIISAGFYWLLFMDKSTKEDTLEYALKFMGKKLMAMVTDESEGHTVRELYDKFINQSVNHEVEPERIEYVTANILNLSKTGVKLNPEQAEAFLKFSLTAPLKIERLHLDSIKLVEKAQLPRLPEPPEPLTMKKNIPPEKWEILARRLKLLAEFDKEMQNTMQSHAEQLRDVQEHMQYRLDDNLKITIDKEIKRKLDQRKYRRLTQELQKMEKERIIVWRENSANELKKEMVQLQIEIEKLKKLEKSHNLEYLDALKTLESLKVLKSFEPLQYIPIISADSIRVIAKHSLKKSGVHEDNTQK